MHESLLKFRTGDDNVNNGQAPQSHQSPSDDDNLKPKTEATPSYTSLKFNIISLNFLSL